MVRGRNKGHQTYVCQYTKYKKKNEEGSKKKNKNMEKKKNRTKRRSKNKTMLGGM